MPHCRTLRLLKVNWADPDLLYSWVQRDDASGSHGTGALATLSCLSSSVSPRAPAFATAVSMPVGTDTAVLPVRGKAHSIALI